MNMQDEHQHHMRHCISLAKTALAAGDPPVGAIIVFEGTVIGTGIESGRSTGDITNHAEILAVRDAIKNGYANRLYSSGMYTTHEPCIMCAYVIRHHRISEIIFGASVPFVGGATSRFNVLSTEDILKWGNSPRVISGVFAEECEQLSEEFRKRVNGI
jgi:tRNA(adenine34) deaminase